MFFSISNRREDNFTSNYNINNVWINTDAGWSFEDLESTVVIYKGYSDNFCLSQVLSEIHNSVEPFDTGNYCVFFVNKHTGTVDVKTDKYRGFPIYVNPHHTITNLVKQEYTVWTNKLISVNPDITINERKFNVIGDIKNSVLEYDFVVHEIDKILREKTKNFLTNNTLPIKVHLSGGVDSLLVYSYLQEYTDDFELVKCAHIDYDRFWMLNRTDIQTHWGYTQIHHWVDKCVLISGAPGDEFMLRSPYTSDLFLKARGQSVIDLLQKSDWKNCLHADYFSREKHQKIFCTQTVDQKKNPWMLDYDLCNINLNDWQHWHLGNTLTWTPLRDLEIFKLMIRLPLSDAVAQIMNSTLSRFLIKQINPELDKLITDQKNSKNPMKNLVSFLNV
jgi:hypothetical protein